MVCQRLPRTQELFSLTYLCTCVEKRELYLVGLELHLVVSYPVWALELNKGPLQKEQMLF